MPFNPNTGRRSTLCPCGHWNDWSLTDGLGTYEKWDKRDYDRPKQCNLCGRQLRKHPEVAPHRKNTLDQTMLNGQLRLKL